MPAVNRLRPLNRSARLGAVAGAVALFVGGCAGERYIHLKFASTSEDTYYVCESTAKEQKCKEIAKTSLPALDGTAYIIVPKDCDGKFNQIVIQHAQSSTPTAHVICAQIGN